MSPVRPTAVVSLLIPLLSLACAGAAHGPQAARPETPSAPPAPASVSSAGSPTTAAASIVTPSPPTSAAVPPDGKKRLTIAEARRYMLALINRDRKTMNLEPVELDLGSPTAAGQAHAEDMAKNGYLGHWGTDGSVPEQRATEAGGADMVLENALCFTDLAQRELDPSPLIEAVAIEQAESMFFNEVPPNDGHRKNILKPFHKKVGIGAAQPLSTATEIAVPCFSQEFADPYGSYASIPKHMRVGSTLHVEGSIVASATFAGVGLARVESPHAISPAELNTRRTYAIPQPYQMYWPPGFKTPIPVTVSGNKFSIDVPVSDRQKPGLYELSIWGKVPGAPDYVIVSLRSFHVD
jgi:uncharacterized protein YkwD